jgi:hypothetical protein
LPEGHNAGNTDLALDGSNYLWFSLIGNALFSAHIDTISESENSDEGLSHNTHTGDRSTYMYLGSLFNMVGFPFSLFLSDLFLYTFLDFFMVVIRAEGPRRP